MMPATLLLERSYQGKHPLRTLLYLFQTDKYKLFAALIVFIVKHSPSWAMPLLTANVIDIISQPDKHTTADLTFYAVIIAVLLIQNIPTHWLFVRLLSSSIRNTENNLRSALVIRLQHLS